MSQLRAMMARHARVGRLDWIGLRPARRESMRAVCSAMLSVESGLEGDHGRSLTRGLTLIQAEHLPVVAALTGGAVTAEMLRRNVVVSGINLLALKGRDVRIGNALIEVTAPCPPCSRMEETLGHGGYSAMRGHGGVYARVVSGGLVELGDSVSPARSAE